jgi:transposase InsO family protein
MAKFSVEEKINAFVRYVNIYHEHEGCYGYHRIRSELANRGSKVKHKKVQRIMKARGLICMVRIKKYKSYKGTVGKNAPNRLEHQFTAEAPNEKWVFISHLMYVQLEESYYRMFLPLSCCSAICTVCDCMQILYKLYR